MGRKRKVRLYYAKVKQGADLSWVRTVALTTMILTTGCMGLQQSTTTPTWQLASRLSVGMKKNQVNKIMRWQKHGNRSYSSPTGAYEDWIYNPGNRQKQVHLRFHKGRLIAIGLNQKPST